MHVVRGRGADPERDDEVTGDLLARTAETGETGLRVWRPHRQLAFGRRDTHMDGYREARELAIEYGFRPIERRAGGHAVAYTGSTIAVARTDPVDDPRSGIEERYGSTTIPVQRALWKLGVPAQHGEPEASFCPGGHSLQWRGKIAGFAQRVETDVALVGGIVVVRDHDELGDVLGAIYDSLGIGFDSESVSSIERAGGRADPGEAVRTLEDALIPDDSHVDPVPVTEIST